MSSLVFELLAVVRAIDEHGPGSSKGVIRADTSFHPTRTATWVNGLWYVSLTLSLATALVAALTKQWIHQHMNYAQLGTPRARARLRHFRYLQLQAWHVPAIIGLLPVMMHIALGLFLLGLIIHTRALSPATCFVVSGLVLLTLLVYGGTNLFPVYNPACPYKTPLSHYAYVTSRRISGLWEVLIDYILSHKFSLSSNNASALQRVRAETKSASLSLFDSEEALVKTAAASHSLDAQVAAWLYSASSNSSVQNIMLQALGNLPLRTVQIVKDSVGVGALENVLSRALNSPDFADPSKQSAYERLLRSLYRLFPDTSTTFFMKPNTPLSRLLDIGRPNVAAEFVCDQILTPYRKYDPAIWVQILANAFSSGPDWLLESPAHWRAWISWFTGEHECSMCLGGRNTSNECYTLLLTVVHPSRRNLQGTYGRRFLTVTDDGLGASPDQEMNMRDATVRFLGPSICDLMLYIAYPSSSLTIHPRAVPSDIRLRLALIQTDWVWRTCSSSPDDTSMIANIIRSIRGSVGVDGTSAHNHGGVMSATFHALKDVTLIVTDSYGTGVISTAHRQRLLHPFFRSLAVSEENLLPHYQSWMTDSIPATIVQMVFAEPIPVVLPLISDLLVATVRTACPILLPKICVELCKREWLDAASRVFFDETPWDSEVSASICQKRLYTLMLAAYIEALYVLRDNLSPTYSDVLAYSQKPSNLLTLCQILLLSDVERSSKLWQLAPLIGRSQWAPCLDDIDTFITAEGTRNIYKVMISAPLHPYQDGRRLSYPAVDELPTILARFKGHIETHPFGCDCHVVRVHFLFTVPLSNPRTVRRHPEANKVLEADA